jgi:hypothetical protein
VDHIRESLDRLAELSDADLAALKDTVVSEFGTVKSQELSEDVVKTLTELADVKDQIVKEQKHRIEIAAQLSSQAEDAASRMESDSDSEVQNEGQLASDPTEDEKEAGEPDVEVIENPSDDEDDEKKNFSEAEVNTAIETPVEAEAAVTEETVTIETPEAELSADESTSEAEVPEVPVEENPVAEVTVAEEETLEEKTAEAELASEEVEKESSEEPVTASINSEELNLEVPAGHGPAEVTSVKAPITITAGADIPHVPAGSELPDLKAVASAIIARKHGMGRTSGGDGEFHSVATFTTSFPEERYLTRNDIEINRAKIDDVLEPKGLVAAGGLAAPVEIRYELFGLGSTKRPVKDSLAVFGAERGGIRFVTPPVITDLSGAVSLWTVQDDIDASTAGAPDPVKPCLRVAAGAEVTVNIEAIPLCLTFGNMGARAYPELVERHTELAMVNHARFAETRLLTRIGTLSTAVTTTAKLGAARDIFAAIDQAAAAYRNRHRIDVNSPLRAIFPEWFKNALRADLIKQIPGDGNDDTFGLVDGKISAWFKVRNINVTWSMDGESGQIFGAQGAGALAAFPGSVIWYLFAEGTFLFLDGGTLDLGLVRDSTLNSTNDYKIFLETFEGVAKVGVESLRVTSALSILGASAATIA